MDSEKVVTASGAVDKATGMPKFSADETIKKIRAAGMNNPEIEEAIRRAEQNYNDAYRKYGYAFPPIILPTEEEKIRMKETVLSGYEKGESFSGKDF